MDQNTSNTVDSTDELTVLRQQLATAQAEARAREAFLGQVGHELRTPLTTIANLVAVLKLRSDLPDDIIPVVNMMERNLWREVRLVEDLVDTFRIARGELNLRRKPVELDALLRHTAGQLADDFDEGDVRLELQLNGAGAHADGDPDRLAQVIRILLNHARQATPRGRQVTVSSAHVDHQRLTVGIEDGGMGMTAEQLTALFDPMSASGDTRARRLQVGMPIAKGIVEAHGGSLQAISRGPGRGTLFNVVLPAADG